MKRLLIVDDDPDILEGLSLLLEKNYHLCLARDGAEALRYLENGYRPDAIVLDLMMPVLDGASMMREMEKRNMRFPVLIASAHANTPGKARELRADDYIVKPFNFQVLQTKIAQLLDRSEDGRGGPPAADRPMTRAAERLRWWSERLAWWWGRRPNLALPPETA